MISVSFTGASPGCCHELDASAGRLLARTPPLHEAIFGLGHLDDVSVASRQDGETHLMLGGYGNRIADFVGSKNTDQARPRPRCALRQIFRAKYSERKLDELPQHSDYIIHKFLVVDPCYRPRRDT